MIKWAFLLLLFFLLPLVHADPATRPATAPAPVKADQSSAKGVVKLFLQLVEAGKPEETYPLLYVPADNEEGNRQMVRWFASGYARLIANSRKLETAVTARFGPKAAAELSPPWRPPARLHNIDAWVEKTDKDGRARIVPPEEKPGMKTADTRDTWYACKVGDKWLFVVSDQQDSIALIAVFTNISARICGEVADEVQAGRHQTVKEVLKSLEEKVPQKAEQFDPRDWPHATGSHHEQDNPTPTTAPTFQPARQPALSQPNKR